MQLNLVSKTNLRSIKACTHGGVSLKKRRKVARPLIPGLITHVVLKSSKAKGNLSFYKHKKLVTKLFNEKKKKFFIEILDWVKVRFKDRMRFAQFLKSLTALIARQITGAKKGNKFGKFWDGLVYTRVLLTKLEEYGLSGYFEANHRQREYGYQDRISFLKRFNQYIYRLRQVRASNGTLVRDLE